MGDEEVEAGPYCSCAVPLIMWIETACRRCGKPEPIALRFIDAVMAEMARVRIRTGRV